MPALESTQPPIQWVQLALSQGEERLGNEADKSPPLHADVKNMQSITSTPICLYGVHNGFAQNLTANKHFIMLHIPLHKGRTSPGHQVACTTQLCMLLLIFVGPQYKTCTMSSFWHLYF